MSDPRRGRLLPGRRRRGTALVALAAVAGVTTACGVPTGEDSFSPVDAGDVPFGLSESSTTTTTTTTLPAVPLTTPPEAPETTIATTTTLPTEMVELYFLSRGELQPVPGELPVGFGINQLASSLEAGPPAGTAGIGLDTLVGEGLIVDSATRAGVVTVDLAQEEFNDIEARDQRFAIGQIVLTYTSNLRGVGQVSFTLSREPLQVPTGDGLLSEPGQPLAYDDYAVLLADRPTDASAGGDGRAPATSIATTAPDPSAVADTDPATTTTDDASTD